METPIESTTVASETAAQRRRRHASETPAETATRRRRNHAKAPKSYDGRLAIGRRVRELENVFRTRLGPDVADDPVMSTAIRRCAETVALSEHLRARMLRGENVSPDDVLRTTRAADALTRRLYLDRSTPKREPTIADYLATRVGRP
jgi:hypothetical protein